MKHCAGVKDDVHDDDEVDSQLAAAEADLPEASRAALSRDMMDPVFTSSGLLSLAARGVAASVRDDD